MPRSRKVAETTAFRSEEHTSELQSQSNLVCRLLLEKKNINLHPSVLGSRGPALEAHIGGRLTACPPEASQPRVAPQSGCSSASRKDRPRQHQRPHRDARPALAVGDIHQQNTGLDT